VIIAAEARPHGTVCMRDEADWAGRLHDRDGRTSLRSGRGGGPDLRYRGLKGGALRLRSG